MAAAARRAGTALVVVVLVVIGLAIGGRALWRAATSAVKADGCDFGTTSLDTDQAQVASVVVGVVLKRGLPERAAVLTIGAALQESKLRNLPGGDRDSVGILQQRPSQGWGTAAQISDIHYATGKFLDAVIKVPNWQTGSLASVVQKVQISADGTAYAKHEADAQAISDALMGKTAAGVNCHFSKPTVAETPAVLSKAVLADLPVTKPTQSGKTLTVSGAGWATAAWFVCNADQRGIDSVSYSGQTWTRAKGWRADSNAVAGGVTATTA